MEPILVVPEPLRPVLAELQRLEPLFHAAAAEATVAWFEELVAPEFWEIGASGRRYSRAFALRALRERPGVPAADNWQTRDFHLAQIGRDNFLLTYTLVQPGRTTLRSTTWRRAESGWKIVFHQGTVVAG